MESPKRYCPECQDPIRGRMDKKFCSDGCRSLHHNRLNSIKSSTLKWIDKRLKKNRNILEKLYHHPAKRKEIPIKQVEHLGFTFDFDTHKEVLKKQEYVFCYDYGYKMRPDNRVELIKRQLFGDGLDLFA